MPIDGCWPSTARPGPWLPPGFEVLSQVTGPFERRLAAAWAAAGGPGVQIGMDTPQVTSGLLDRSLGCLERPGVDAVLGPAADGGWWAIGFRSPPPGAFERRADEHPDHRRGPGRPAWRSSV